MERKMVSPLPSPSVAAVAKFGVYENPAIASALSRQRVRRKPWHLPFVLTLCAASFAAVWILHARVENVVKTMHFVGLSQPTASALVQGLQWLVTAVFLMILSALFKVANMQPFPDTVLTLSSRAKMYNFGKPVATPITHTSLLLERQQGSPLTPVATPKKWYETPGQLESPLQSSEAKNRLVRSASRPTPNSPSSAAITPVNPQVVKGGKPPISPWNARSGTAAPGTTTPAQAPAQTPAHAPAQGPVQAPAQGPAQASSQAPAQGQAQASSQSPAQAPAQPPTPANRASSSSPAPVPTPSPGQPATPLSGKSEATGTRIAGQPSTGSVLFPTSQPRSRERAYLEKLVFGRDEIYSERRLKEFLADVDHKLVESSKQASSPASQQGKPSAQTPSPAVTPASATSTPRSAVRALRISPSAPQSGSPSKGELEMPLPMSIEQSTEVLKRLGIYPQIEQWRDKLRQWISAVLLNPLARKIEVSHRQAMAAAAKLDVSISVAQVGSNKPDGNLTPTSTEGQEWLTTIAPDEDAFLHQLRAALIVARDGPTTPQNTPFGLSPSQGRPYNPDVQFCLDAVTEHQRLKALMKGEWVKGLLPQTSVPADYTVQRIRDLAEGTCVKGYEFSRVPHGISKQWTSDLPSDSHLLLYLFCALLEHPQWMLHIDPLFYPSTQSGNNSLYVASLPHKERFPEKYIAIVSGAPQVLHAGATLLAVGKPSPPVFALYWDKKLQYSFQGRQALWDAILLLCYRVKVAHGGVVRGINLASPAYNLQAVLEPTFDRTF